MRFIIPVIVSKFIGSFILISTSAYSQSDCALRKEADSIKVFTCHAANSKFKLIKATFTVHATPTQLASMLMRIEDYTHWQYNTTKAQVLKLMNDHEVIYYAAIAAPWPISNRDMVVHFIMNQNAVTKIITITANGEPNYIPAKDGRVRVPFSASKWIIKPVDHNTLAVEYTIQIDPGGSVPAWMVNMVSAEAPYISFKNLKEKVSDYKNCTSTFTIN